MDFLDPKKKRANRIRLFIGYGLMAIALSIATVILVFEAYGFDVDHKTGEVIQNGLVFVDAHPAPADITLNGEPQGQTDSRLVIPAGKYTVELKRDGYRSWSRTFDLEGGSIERLVYPFLFPEQLDSEDAQLYSSVPSFSTQSPDRRWVIVQQPGSLVGFDLVDLNSETVEFETLSLPQTLLSSPTAGAHTYELIEWSTDNRHVLLKHTFDGGSEFVMVDRETPAASININNVLKVPTTQVVMRDKKFDQLYIYDANGGVLRRANIGNGQITPVLSGVLAFKTHGAEEVLYVTTEGAKAGKVLVKARTPDKLYTIRELPAGDSKYLLEMARFDGKWYIAAGSASEKKVYVYRNPFEALDEENSRVAVPIMVLKSDEAAQYLSFSATVRFLGMQSGSEFAVYDAEMDRAYRYDIDVTLEPGHKATWMDGHRLTLNSEGKVIVFDYDGINKQTLVAAGPNHLPLFDRDYNRLFTISPSTVVPNRSALVMTHMRTPADR